MKVIYHTGGDPLDPEYGLPTFLFTPEERFALAEYLKSARAQGIPTSKAGWDLVHELLPHLEKQ